MNIIFYILNFTFTIFHFVFSRCCKSKLNFLEKSFATSFPASLLKERGATSSIYLQYLSHYLLQPAVQWYSLHRPRISRDFRRLSFIKSINNIKIIIFCNLLCSCITGVSMTYHAKPRIVTKHFA